VVVAHGGQEHSLEEPHDWRHARLRVWPLAQAAHRAAPRAQVALMRYRFRGWNGDDAHAAADVRQVLHAVPERVERLVLVGHSMGGRAVVSVLAGDHCPRTVGVLGLAPWLPVDEPHPRPRDDCLVVLAHGDQDRTVDPRLTAAFAERARRAGVRVALFAAVGDAHALLQRHGDWDQLVARFVQTSLGIAPDEGLLGAVSTDPDHGADPMPAWSRRRGTAGAVARIAASRMLLRPVGSYG
jgi:pimeloyl-ACP methyl ester carboxylesterase